MKCSPAVGAFYDFSTAQAVKLSYTGSGEFTPVYELCHTYLGKIRMSQEHQAQLQEAYQLIKSGQKATATRVLLNVLKADRDNADAWWLLANATSDPPKQRQALNQVLRIKPDHNAAQRMLEKVNVAASMQPSEPKPAPPSAASPFTAAPSDDDPFASPSTPPAAPRTDPFAAPSASDDDPFAAPSTPSRSRAADDAFGDPFGEQQTRIGSTPAQDDDPFGDPFGEQQTRIGSTPAPSDDPFGDPFGASSTSSRGRVEPDPFAVSGSAADDDFGDPFAASGTPSRGASDEDPFAAPAGKPKRGSVDDDPFAAPGYAPPERRAAPPKKKKGANPLVVVLAIIGIVLVLGCGLFALTAVAGINIFTQAVQTAMPEGTFEAAMADLQAAMTANPGNIDAVLEGVEDMVTSMPGTFEVDENGIIGEIVEKGAVGFTEPITAVLEADGFTNHAYKFTGEAGQAVIIELTAQVDDFDVKLTLLGPDGTLVAANDDIDFPNNNLNSRIETTLPTNGVYTVVVSDVGFGGGEYELRLQSSAG